MFVVIFEVQPKAERRDEYLALAGHLKPMLERIDGFIDNERFASTRIEGRVLSLSTWRDEKALVRWRTHAEHHAVQERGRFEIFDDYHLRVGEVVADSHPPVGADLDQMRFDATAVGVAAAVTITEVTPAEGHALPTNPAELIGLLGMMDAGASPLSSAVFESIYNPGKLAMVAAWGDPLDDRWGRCEPPNAASLRHRRIRVIRDYGMSDRREAPQFYRSLDRAAG